jgi:hypothetical protein
VDIEKGEREGVWIWIKVDKQIEIAKGETEIEEKERRPKVGKEIETEKRRNVREIES